MKLSVFLSVAGEGGKQLGERLKKELEGLEEKNGLQFRCFLYSQDQLAGRRLVPSYSEEIRKSNFFVPVLTEQYCHSERFHVESELTMAFARESEVFAMSAGRFNFIFPFAPQNGKELIDSVPSLKGRTFASDVSGLADALVRNSPLALLTQLEDPLGFDKDWPRRFYSREGEPDILLVLGHSGKESPPSAGEIRNLGIPAMEEDLATRYKKSAPDSPAPKLPTQSMRIAEYLPRFIQFLSNQYLAFNPRSRTVPLIPADIDWHLICFRQKLLKTHNLVCFGAGDTNWISRAVLAYYGTLLPTVFDTPGGSHVIFYRARAEMVNGEEDTSGRIEIAKYSESMQQIPAYDEQFGAVLLLLPNPWNADKRVIIAAGLNALGSQAAILALCDPSISAILSGSAPWARVIRGKEEEGERKFQAVGFEVIA